MKWIEDKKSKKWELVRRNGAKKRFGKSSYLSWILHKNAPFSEETKVYTLPQIEYKFWEKMKDPSTGYLRIHSKGADQARFFTTRRVEYNFYMNFHINFFYKKILKAEIKRREEAMAQMLTDFRNKVCGSLIFINILFLVFTIVLKVSLKV